MKKLLWGLLLIGAWSLRAYAWDFQKVANTPIISGDGLSYSFDVIFSSKDSQGVTSTREVVFPGITSLSQLKNTCTSKINEYTAFDEVSQIKANDVISLKPQTIPPTQAQIDENTFRTNYGNWKKMLTAVSVGLKKNTDQDFVDLDALIKTTFTQHPEYLGDVN